MRKGHVHFAGRVVVTAALVVQIVVGNRWWIPGDGLATAAAAADDEPAPAVAGSTPAEATEHAAATGFDYGVDTNSGAFGMKIPIETPPGRLGVQPDLALAYSSTSNTPSVVGAGWTLALPVVRAEPLASYGGALHYQIDGHPLIETTPNTFTTEHDTYARIRLACVTGGCTLTADDRSGLRMRFGGTAEARKTGRWALDRVEDAHGNYLTVAYMTDADFAAQLGAGNTSGGALLPKEIRYTGSPTRAPWYRVAFDYELRPVGDLYYHDALQLRYRIRAIRIVGGDNVAIRTYTLAYTSSPSSGRSLLASVSVTGLYGATGPRPFTMTYGGAPMGFTQFSEPELIASETRAVTGDFDGDGRGDLMTFRRRNTAGTIVHQWQVQLGGANGLGPAATWLQLYPYNWPGTCGDARDRVYAGDWDGDGDTDLFHYAKGCGSEPRWRVLESVGNGFVVRDWIPASQTATGSVFDAENATLLFADFTGDGRADALRQRPSDNSTLLVQSLAGAPGYATTAVSTSASGVPVGAGDFNGDGKADVTFDTGTSLMTVCAETPGWFSPCGSLPRSLGAPSTGEFGGDGKVDLLLGTTTLASGLALGYATEPVAVTAGSSRVATDVDGDGRDDLLTLIANSNYSFTLRTQLRRGNGFVAGATAGFPDVTTAALPACWYNTELQATDVTGDGRADPVVRVRSAVGASCKDYQFVARALEAPAIDRLSTVLTPTGMSLQPTYRRVAEPGLAVALVVIDELRIRDFPRPGGTKGVISPVLETHRYAFAGNRWDAARRELTGFASASDTTVERDLTERVTYYTDVARRGKPATRASARTSTDEVIAGDFYYYTDDTAPPYATELAWHLRTYFDAGGQIAARTLQGYTYDAAGNVTNFTDHGLCGRTDDDRTVATVYRTATDFNVSRPAQVTLYAGALYPPASIPGLSACAGSSLSVVESTLHEYDNSASVVTRGDLTRTRRLAIAPNGAQTWVRTRDYTYRSDGLPATTTDARGHTTSVLAYDPTLDQYPARVRDAAGVEEAREYEPHFGRVSRVTDANDQVQSLAYDGFGRTTSIHTPASDGLWLPTVTYAYGDGFPNWRASVRPYQTGSGAMQGAASVTFLDGLGRSIATVHDGDAMTERVITGKTSYWAASTQPALVVPPAKAAVTSCGSILTCLAYWAAFDPAQVNWATLVAPATGTPARFTYDPLGRTVRRDNPDSSYVTYTHTVDAIGFGLDEVDEVGDQRRIYRDAHGDVARVERGATPPEVTTYTHDVRGKLTGIVTPLGTTTTLAHDSFGRLVGVVSPELGTMTFGYDDDGHETFRSDGRGVSVATFVDELGRPTYRSSSTGDFAMYAYDRDWLCLFSCVAPANADNTMGRPWIVLDATGQTTYAYDRDGHVARETRYLSGSGTTHVTQYTTYAGGELVRKVYPDGETHRFALAPDGRQAALYIGSAIAPAVEVTRDAHGRPATIRYASGGRMQYHVDPLTQRIDTIDTYDPKNARVQHVGYGFRPDGTIESVDRDDALGGDESLYLAHDVTKRLTDVYVQPDTASPAEHYEYDADGRVHILQSRGAPVRELEYNDPQHPHAVTQIGTRSLAYDGAGNRISDDGTTIQYDGRSRMIAHGATSYVYDADGRRTIEQLPAGRRVTFAGYTIEPDGSTRKQLQLAGVRVGERSSLSGDRWFHADGLGSVIGESTASGAFATSRTFSAFGATVDQVGGGSRFGFAGYARDDSGLYFANARHYDPSTASFTTPDSWLSGLASPDAINAYAYAANSPYRYTDPSGHIILELAVIATVTFAVAMIDDIVRADGHPDWGKIVVRNLILAGISTAAGGLTAWAFSSSFGVVFLAPLAYGAANGATTQYYEEQDRPRAGAFDRYMDSAILTGFGSVISGSLGAVLGSMIIEANLPTFLAMFAAITTANIQRHVATNDPPGSPIRLEAPVQGVPRVPACGEPTPGATVPRACERLAP